MGRPSGVEGRSRDGEVGEGRIRGVVEGRDTRRAAGTGAITRRGGKGCAQHIYQVCPRCKNLNFIFQTGPDVVRIQ